MKLPKTRCLKPVAVATPHLPDERLPKKAEKESPRFSFWERTPAEHFIDYLESRLPPGPRRRRTAVNRANLVSIFWTTGLPLVSFTSYSPTAAHQYCAFIYGNLWIYIVLFLQLLWICPWVPWGYLDSVGFLMSFYVVAMIFDWFCFVRLWVRRMYELEMKEFEMKELERKEIEMEGNDR